MIVDRLSIAAAAALLVSAQSAPVPGERSPAPQTDETIVAQPVPIRFEGLLPGNVDPRLAGAFQVEFRIYRSPQGGEPIWRETRSVDVANGRMDVLLGADKPIAFDVHESTFKFLGASVNGGREIYPRFAIVNVVYVSPLEIESARAERNEKVSSKNSAYAIAPRTKVDSHTEPASTWRSAFVAARRSGADLPDYVDWYASFGECAVESARERAGHYEWVLPWVYDPASHAELNRSFRGRFQGCDYMDLAPTNAYAWRKAVPAAAERPGRTSAGIPR